MTRPTFTAFVRIRPDGVEPSVLADNTTRLDGAEGPTTQSTDVPWAAPSEAELEAMLEEVVALAREPLPLDDTEEAA